MVREFDVDTRVELIGEGRWRGTVTDRWNIGSAANGGYMASIALAAAAEASPHPDPFAVTTSYLRRVRAGEVELEVDVLRAGGSLSTVAARMIQGGEELMRQNAVFGDIDALDGPTNVLEGPPDLAPPDSLPSSRDVRGLPEIMSRFDFRVDPASLGGLMGAPTGVGEIACWLRFADGREPDLASLVLFADAGPPAVLNLAKAGWVPTIELSVQLRRRPAPGWLRGRFRTRYLIGGYLEEDGELWDSGDDLVALSRQFARVHQPRRSQEGGDSVATD